MFKKIALVLALLIAGVLGFAASKPDSFSVRRAESIKAPPDKVFALINDFRRWESWSPWERKDPAMKRTYGAVAGGKGAAYAGDGNNDVGQGSIEIVESNPSMKIALKLDFVKPFEGHNQVEFTLEPKGDKGEMTEVTWMMQGPAPFMSKLMQVFVSMDSLVGRDFEAGLANLKAVAER